MFVRHREDCDEHCDGPVVVVKTNHDEHTPENNTSENKLLFKFRKSRKPYFEEVL